MGIRLRDRGGGSKLHLCILFLGVLGDSYAQEYADHQPCSPCDDRGHHMAAQAVNQGKRNGNNQPFEQRRSILLHQLLHPSIVYLLLETAMLTVLALRRSIGDTGPLRPERRGKPFLVYCASVGLSNEILLRHDCCVALKRLLQALLCDYLDLARKQFQAQLHDLCN